MDEKQIVNQHVGDNSTAIQLVGRNLFGIMVSGLPEVLVALLLASIVAQCGGYIYAAATLQHKDQIHLALIFPGACYPFIFGPFAFFSFFIGLVAKNKKVTFLSLLSGIISIFAIVLINLAPTATLNFLNSLK